MRIKIIYITVAALLIASGLWFATRSSATNEKPTLEYIPVRSITHGHGLAVDPNNSDLLYIATHHGLLVLKNEKDLFQVGKKQDDYMGFSPNATDSSVFYSSGHPESDGNIGFQKSDDGGFTWKHISNGLNGPVDFHAMAVSPVDSNVVYGWFQGDLQVTEDGGSTWKKYQTHFPVVNLAADTANAKIVYASSPLGLYKSNDGGITWVRLFEGFVATAAVNPKNQRVLSLSEKYGLAESSDGGSTWKSTSEKFSGETPLFITFYRGNPDLVYLLTERNSLYKSADGGTTWKKLPALSSSE